MRSIIANMHHKLLGRSGIILIFSSFAVSVVRQSSTFESLTIEFGNLLTFSQALLILLGIFLLISKDLKVASIHLNELLNKKKTIFTLMILLFSTFLSPGNKVLTLFSNLFLGILVLGFYLLVRIRWSDISFWKSDIKAIILFSNFIILLGVAIDLRSDPVPARFSGLIEGPNFLGLFSATSILIFLLYARNGIKKRFYLYLPFVFIMAVTLQASGTRTSLLALLLTLVFLRLVYKISIAKRILFVALFGTSLFILFTDTYPTFETTLENGSIVRVSNTGYTAIERILKVDPHEGSGGILTGRIEIWDSATSKILANPIFGHGFNPLQDATGFFTHNGILQLAFYLGIPATLFFLWLLCLFSRHVFREKYVWTGGILIFILLNSMFSDFILGAGGPIWLLLAFLISFGYSYDSREKHL
jgi:O-antigen ligase